MSDAVWVSKSWVRYRRPTDLFVWIGCRLIDSWVTERRSGPSRHLALTRRRSAPRTPHRHRGSATERFLSRSSLQRSPRATIPGSHRSAKGCRQAAILPPSRPIFLYRGNTGVTFEPARCNRLRRLLRCRSGHGAPDCRDRAGGNAASHSLRYGWSSSRRHLGDRVVGAISNARPSSPSSSVPVRQVL